MCHPHRALLLATGLLPGSLAAQEALTAERFFATDRLVRVDIEIPEADWDALRSQTRSFSKALGADAVQSPFRYFKGHVTVDGVRIENVGIRKKGFLGSLDRHRPSLKIKFDEFQHQAPVRGLDRLTLNNNKQDPTQACAVLGLALFRAAGVPASRCNLAKVTVNGRSLGIYSNVESIKPPMLQRLFGDGRGELFEGTIADFRTDAVEKFQKKNGRTTLEPIRRLAEIMAPEDVAQIDLARLGEVLNVEAFLKFWAVESLIGFWDGYTNNQNNFFVYRKPADGKLYFMPWGVDSAFVATMPMPPFIIRTKAVHSQALLPNKLYRIPLVEARYRKTLEALLEDVWDEAAIQADIDRIEKLVDGQLHENQRASAGAFKKLRGFVKTRRQVMERSLNRWPVRLTTGPRQLMTMTKIGSASARFSTTWRSSLQGRTGDGELELTLDGEKIGFRKVTAIAERSQSPSLDGGQKPPSVVVIGERASDGVEIILAMVLAIDEFRPSSGRTVLVQGALVEGRLGFLNFRGMKMISGEATLEAAAMEPGAPVRGSATVEISRMQGGEAPPLRR